MLPPSQSPPPLPPQPSLTSWFQWLWVLWDYCIEEVDDPNAERQADALLIAASVIAAMTYQAAISPPGGAYQDTLCKNNITIHQAGQSIAAYVTPLEYKFFSIANTISFTSSMTTMFLFLSGLSLKRRIVSFLLTATMFLTITATTFSYKLAMEATTPDHDESLRVEWNFVNRLVTGALVTWFVVAGITIAVFFGLLLKDPVTTTYRRAAGKHNG